MSLSELLIAVAFAIILILKLISYYCIYITLFMLYKNKATFLILAFVSDMVISIVLKLRARPSSSK